MDINNPSVKHLDFYDVSYKPFTNKKKLIRITLVSLKQRLKAVWLNNDITNVLTNNLLTKCQTWKHEPLKRGLGAVKWASDEYKVVTEILYELEPN